MPSTSMLVPHAVCWAAAPHLIWTMVITNLITFLSYLSICVTLLFLARRTGRSIRGEWRWFVVGFALFIVACGSTHLLEVITTWTPIFWVDAWTNIITAALSAYVAINLIRRVVAIGFGINDYADRLADTENEKLRMESSLLAARKLEDWSRMSATLAHEIANPLEAVQNLLYLIRSAENAPPEITGLARTAAEEADRVLTISRSTLSFFRQGSAPERLDLLRAVESVRLLLQPMLEERQLVFEVSSQGDATVEAMPGEARQVLLNLVRNACEASTRAGARISVELVGRAAEVQVRVADQGSGIAASLLPNLFQFGQSTKGEHGTGMGLWTVKHILERHGGRVAVESAVGVGTTFTLYWPRVFATEKLVVEEGLAAAR